MFAEKNKNSSGCFVVGMCGGRRDEIPNRCDFGSVNFSAKSKLQIQQTGKTEKNTNSGRCEDVTAEAR